MVECRRLAAEDVEAVSELQRRVFGFSDLDLLPGPLLNVVARDTPSVGLNLGAFLPDSSHLTGAILSFATFEPGAVYAVALGVFPEYQGMGVGRGLLLAFREAALAKGLRTMYGVFDPTDAKLGRLYVGGVGFVGTRVLGKTLLFRWDFESPHVRDKLAALGYPSPVPGETRIPLPSRPDEREAFLANVGEHLDRGSTIVDCVPVTSGGERLSSYVLRPPS